MMKVLLILLCLLGLALVPYRERTVWAVRTFIRPPLSKAVNYAVYWFRRAVLFQSAEKARREHHADHAERMADLALRRDRPNIVVANANRDKYTETFVRRHIEVLRGAGFYVHQLYGGDLPTTEARSGLILSNSPASLAFYSWAEKFLDLPSGHFQRRAFKRYLAKNRIELVVAEFGTCGAQIYDLCEVAGVPLIVIFHGYDAHHSRFVEANRDRYAGLFRYASAIVCVSRDIMGKLGDMQAPLEKLVHLPCGFDEERFTYSDHSANPPVFLAVGRFAETKGPHLTIFAFHEALKSIPDAELVMVGKDGGGELFEACHQLVRALGIESRVHFKGILDSDGVLTEMRRARVFVQHSVTTPLHSDREGTPVSVMEAMACGLPIIATAHAGISELVGNEASGVLVEEYDISTMAAEMVRVCLSDELVFTFGRNAAEAIRQNEAVMDSGHRLTELAGLHRRAK